MQSNKQTSNDWEDLIEEQKRQLRVALSRPICHDELSARKYLEAWRWPNGPRCPFKQCQPHWVSPLGGKSMGDGWYHCRHCRKKFTVRVETMFHRSSIPLHKWIFAVVYTRKASYDDEILTASELCKMVNITPKSARSMLKRIDDYWERNKLLQSVWWEDQPSRRDPDWTFSPSGFIYLPGD